MNRVGITQMGLHNQLSEINNEDKRNRDGAACMVTGGPDCFCTSVLELLGPVVGAVFALHAEVDVGADAAVVQLLDRAHIVTHAQEDLRRLVLAQQPQGVHLTGRETHVREKGLGIIWGEVSYSGTQ